MIEKGTRIIIDGIPYKIAEAMRTINGTYVLVVTHDATQGTEFRQSIGKVMEKLADVTDRFVISEIILDWFTDEKLKSGVNTGQILAIKANPRAGRAQIRRLMKNGEDVETILETLAFAINDKFWSGVLNTSINTIATPKQDGLTLYEKIKSQMIAHNQSNVVEVYQRTEEDMAGAIIVE